MTSSLESRHDHGTPPSRAQTWLQFRLEEAKKSGKADLIKQAYEEDRDVRADADQAAQVERHGEIGKPRPRGGAQSVLRGAWPASRTRTPTTSRKTAVTAA
jgi:hypothetical protein